MLSGFQGNAPGFHDENDNVRYRGQYRRVGDGQNGRSVNDDEIVVFPLGEQEPAHGFRSEKFGRVGRGCAGADEIQAGYAGVVFGFVKGGVAGQNFGQPRRFAVAEFFVQGGTAQIAVDDEDAGARLGDDDGFVGGDGAFAFPRESAGEEHDLLFFVDGGEVQVGAQRAECFSHHGFGLFLGDQGLFGRCETVFSGRIITRDMRNGCQKRQPRGAFGFFGILDGVVQIFLKEGQADAQRQSEQQSQQQVLSDFRLDGTAGGDGRIDNVDVADGGGLGDAGFFMFLQEEGVDVGVDFGNTGEACQVAFDIGEGLHFFFVGAQMAPDGFFLFGQVEAAGFVNAQQFVLHFVNLVLHGFDGLMRFGVAGQKGFFLHFQIGQFRGQGFYVRVAHHDAGHVDFIFFHRFFQGFAGKLDLLPLQVDVGAVLFQPGYFFDQGVGFAVQGDNAGGAFVDLKVFFGGIQMAAQRFDLIVDKRDGPAGFFALEGDGLLQVGLHQGVDDVARQNRIGAGVGDFDDAGLAALFNGLDVVSDRVHHVFERGEFQTEAVAGISLDVVQKQAEAVLFHQDAAGSFADEIAFVVSDVKGVLTGKRDVVNGGSGLGFKLEDPEGKTVRFFQDIRVQVQPPDYVFGIGAGFDDFDFRVGRIGGVERQFAEDVVVAFAVLDVQHGGGFVNRFHQEGVQSDCNENGAERGEEYFPAPHDDGNVFEDVFLLGSRIRGCQRCFCVHDNPFNRLSI